MGSNVNHSYMTITRFLSAVVASRPDPMILAVSSLQTLSKTMQAVTLERFTDHPVNQAADLRSYQDNQNVTASNDSES